MRDALMVSQLAFAVVLMIGAGLLLETLRDLLRQNPGFNPSQVVTANIYLPNPNNPQLDPYHTLAQQIPFNRDCYGARTRFRAWSWRDYVQFAGRRHNQ